MVEILTFAVGVVAGIALCVAIPKLPSQMKQISKNIQQQYNKGKEQKAIGNASPFQQDKDSKQKLETYEPKSKFQEQMERAKERKDDEKYSKDHGE